MQEDKESIPQIIGSGEVQAAFRLGQMDMQRSVLDMLAKLEAQVTNDSARTVVRAIAGAVKSLEVLHAE